MGGPTSRDKTPAPHALSIYEMIFLLQGGIFKVLDSYCQNFKRININISSVE